MKIPQSICLKNKCISILTIVLLLPSIGNAAIRYVKANAVGLNNGTSWTNAFTDFQAAIDASFVGDVIFVSKGTYLPGNGQSFSMKEGVKMYGHFAGTETSLSQRDLNSTDTTKLVGNNYRVISNDNNGLTSAAVLDGFTITGGSSAGYGGGMYNYNASPTLSNCLFINNTATYGGGIFNYNSSSAITDCTFLSNTAEYGGAMINDSCSTPIINCLFSNNLVLRYGGGILNNQSSSLISNCTFTNNVAQYFYGGGICSMYYSSVTINDCIFSNNSADHGGGVYSNYTSTVINNCDFVDNSAANGGGGLSILYSSANKINGCLFDNNTTPYYGGAIFNYSSESLLTSSTLVSNSATEGSGIYNRYHASLGISNSILWNIGVEVSNSDSSTITVSYCDIEEAYPGVGNINSNPLFVDADNGNYRLLCNSPCFNSGINDSIPIGMTHDLDDSLRLQGAIIDMGAYEFDVTVLPPSPVANNLIVYSLGDVATPLSATGNNLLWYSVPVGGVGTSTPPVPSTLVAGTTSYWVGQIDTSVICQSLRTRIDVVVHGLANINDMDDMENIRVYPNPSQGNFFICLHNAEANFKIDIMSIEGRVLFTKNILNSSVDIDIPINVVNIPSGTYFICLSTDERSIINRIIIIE